MPQVERHEWELETRFRRHAFRWKSQPAITRVKEAVTEIEKVSRKDPSLAAEGAVIVAFSSPHAADRAVPLSERTESVGRARVEPSVRTYDPPGQPPEIPIDDPRDVRAIRRRLEARRALRDRDGARALADVLVWLGEANASERAMASALATPLRRCRALDGAGWAQLGHPDLDPVVSGITEVLWPAVLSNRGKPDRDFGISPRYAVDPARTDLTLVRTLATVAGILGMHLPRVFVRSDVPGGITHLPAWPLASLCGSTLLSGFSARDLTFICGVHLAWYRGPLYLVTLAPSTLELAALIGAALVLGGVVRSDLPSITQVRVAIAPKLNPLQVEALRLLGPRLRVPALGSVEAALLEAATRWRRAAWLTTHRAGLLVTQNLETSIRMIETLGPAFPGSSVDDAKDALLRFAISRRYVELRARIGANASAT